jgi:hypothetical protein
MASVILSGTPAGLAVDDPVLANPVVAQGTGGGQFVAKWSGAIVEPGGAVGNGVISADCGVGNNAGVVAIQLRGGANPAAQVIRWGLGCAGREPVPAAGDAGNDLALWAYNDDGSFESGVLTVSRSKLGVSFIAPVQCGIAPLATGDQTVNVANTAVTAGSVIICSMTGAEDSANVIPDGVVITPGVGFQIQLRGIVSSSPSTSGVAWFVAKF